MYFIVNLETRNALTYPAGDRFIEANEEVAKGKAMRAQQMLDVPCEVVPISNVGNDALGREVAPWFKK